MLFPQYLIVFTKKQANKKIQYKSNQLHNLLIKKSKQPWPDRNIVRIITAP